MATLQQQILRRKPVTQILRRKPVTQMTEETGTDSRSPSDQRRAPRTRTTRMTAGPATGTACVSTMKMPVPIVAPMPNSESWKSPIDRASWPSAR